MANRWLVVKIGGSVLERGALAATLADILAASPRPLAVVPGGGPFAEAVRIAQAQAGFSDRLAHRLALSAMGAMAEVFATLAPALTVEASPSRFALVAAAGRVPVWNPAPLAAGDAAIPETWDVTSDSLAVHLAALLGASRVQLLKSCAVPPGVSLAELSARGIVDAALPAFAARFAGLVEVVGAAAIGASEAA